ncbi:MAG: glycosyltransferase involved in cell wall biosynthesis [Lentimonas sp.]|jgi:glycosyltransferase involved in cell wall biosynthesis
MDYCLFYACHESHLSAIGAAATSELSFKYAVLSDPMSRARILFLDDNPDYGGHQLMAAHGLEAVLQSNQWDVRGLYNPENVKNRARWEAIASGFSQDRFQMAPAATSSGRFQALKSHFIPHDLEALRLQISAFEPDLILVIQGNIEQSCSIFSIKGELSCPLVSYIPLPHKHQEMGAQLGLLRDWTCRGLYAVPDGYITLSATLATMLQDYGAKGPVHVVENGIALESYRDLPASVEARRLLGLPETGYLWGHVGRTEYKQKGQDVSLAVFAQRAALHPEEHLVFLGSGPDDRALHKSAQGHPRVHCLAWRDQLAVFYAAVDALLLPSRYEGVPLVMLEALACGVPVVSTDRDGMRDWLPSSWRFPYRDRGAFLAAMTAVRADQSGAIEALKQKVWRDHSMESFHRAFNLELHSWI